MNTKTLVVGQDVYMLNSAYIIKGKVVKVTPLGVDVQESPWKNRLGGQIYHFDASGKEIKPEWNFPEEAPFELDDTPFVERTVLLEQAARDYKARTS